jgi:hypothetical protein
LRLDTAAAIRQGGESGPAVVAHAAEDSLLITAVTGADGWRMPPEGEPLTAEEIAKLKTWIDAGAAGPAEEPPALDPRDHWAYKPPTRPAVPPAGANWARNPIDAFLAAEHARHGLTPRPEARKETLLRRVYIDLIGLPPTSEELESFLADTSDDPYEKAVDRLLASPQYGERWARHWMDIWRYSDWYGYGAEIRNSQFHIWRWRDWIIESLAADKGYDQMILEMLAGDELAPDDPGTVRATGYIARNWYKFNRNTWLQDVVEHTGKAFLATTFNCARCHDHKYDPIRQEDYYRLRAFFEPHGVRTDVANGELDRAKDGIARVYDADLEKPTYLFVRGDEKEPDTSKCLTPGLPAILHRGELVISSIDLPTVAWYPGIHPGIQQAVLRQAVARVDAAQAALASVKEKLAAGKQTDRREDAEEIEGQVLLAEKACSAALADLLAVQARIAADRAKFAQPPDPQAAALALAAGHAERRAKLENAECELQKAEADLAAARAKADASDAAQEAVGKAEAKLSEARKAAQESRDALANLTSDYTPLDQVYPATSTGRRLALARWIASRENPLTARVAVNHIWLRHFGRALVPTVFDFGMAGQKPSHPELLDWLAVDFMENGWSMKHLHRLIVTSSAYRMDSACAGSDDPNLRIDPDNRFVWRMNCRRADAEVIRDSLLHLAESLDTTQGGPELDHQTADVTNRRSIYYRHANEKRVTFLELFDQPGGGEGYQRTESIVPQQALALLNSRFVIEHSRRLAGQLWSRVITDASDSSENLEERFVALCFRKILCRDPSQAELGECLEFVRSGPARLASTDSLTPFGQSGEADQRRDDPQARARASLVHVLFNHNDFVAVR